MMIHTLWAQRTDNNDDGDAPELLVAWDEYCMDLNGEGYEEAVKKAIEDGGGLGPGKGLSAVREVVIEVSEDDIYDAFANPEVKGEVVGGRSGS